MYTLDHFGRRKIANTPLGTEYPFSNGCMASMISASFHDEKMRCASRNLGSNIQSFEIHLEYLSGLPSTIDSAALLPDSMAVPMPP